MNLVDSSGWLSENTQGLGYALATTYRLNFSLISTYCKTNNYLTLCNFLLDKYKKRGYIGI